ncbi:hypothetical protein [Spiroplasma endosymbiont of Tricholauxania praeusta]|uniref:hypothetical protein n=1 Tax=Spiroplasma endosymbiont of Tricholauxania praeusta TaxID=3066296 RepID=UPI0030D1E0F3
MKKILSIFTISILASLLFTSNIINIDSNKTDNNVVNKNSLLPKKESTNKPLTHLFNNQYNYLTNSNWITNQSDLDQKFYSYDTNHANYKLSNDINAREVFFVDNDGNLNYDSTLILEKDKLNIENTKQEMINYKKVTKTKDKKIYLMKVFMIIIILKVIIMIDNIFNLED